MKKQQMTIESCFQNVGRTVYSVLTFLKHIMSVFMIIFLVRKLK